METNRRDFFKKSALIGLSGVAGQMFGKNGFGFERINIACPREIIKKALEQLKSAVDTLSD